MDRLLSVCCGFYFNIAEVFCQCTNSIWLEGKMECPFKIYLNVLQCTLASSQPVCVSLFRWLATCPLLCIYASKRIVGLYNINVDVEVVTIINLYFLISIKVHTPSSLCQNTNYEFTFMPTNFDAIDLLANDC